MSTDEQSTTTTSVLRSFLPSHILQWVGVVGVLGLVAAIGGGALLISGAGPLSAVPPHPEGWAKLLHFASSRGFLHNAKDSPPSAEPLDSSAMIMRGATEYALVCADCHGAPGFGQNPVALSARPEPPWLVDISKKLSANELYGVVKNGVRYTGMPAWPVQDRPDEIWAVVSFLEAMPTMDRATYLRLSSGSEDGIVPRQKNANAALTIAPGTAKSIAPFIPTNENRPYLPGDPQEVEFSSSAGTVLPRTGYVRVEGGDLAATCVSCHGAESTGRPGGGFPNLTLQSPQYIYDSLHAFAAGQRRSGIMWLVAGSLSDEQMRSLALQIGIAPPRRSASRDGSVARAEITRGDDIAHAGLAPDGAPSVATTKGSPAPPIEGVERCTSCHLALSEVEKVIPALHGQNAAYFRDQMRLFRAGGRGDTTSYNPMVAESQRLSDADIDALADYYASLPPLEKKQARLNEVGSGAETPTTKAPDAPRVAK